MFQTGDDSIFADRRTTIQRPAKFHAWCAYENIGRYRETKTERTPVWHTSSIQTAY